MWRFLLRKSEAPWWMRTSAYLLTMGTVWVVLGILGAGFAATLGGGALAGLIADQIVEAWWLRRERQRDVANGYVGKRRLG